MEKYPSSFDMERKLVKHLTEPKYEISAGLVAPEDAELMIEPKRSCRHCYGRGSQMWLVGDGYKVEDGKKVPNMQRTTRPCPCVFRNAKFRIK